MATETNLDKLTINYLTEEEYAAAKEEGNINENELYFTPDDNANSEVLWENPDPSAEFAAQTIQLKENNYKYFRIEILMGTKIFVQDVLPNTSFQISYTGTYVPGGKGYLAYYYRPNNSCTQTSMAFSGGGYILTNGTTITDDNTKLIPSRVIGYNL